MTPTDIRALRRRLGLSQAAFAVWLGVSREHVLRIEAGTKDPGPTLARLLDAIHKGYRPEGVA